MKLVEFGSLVALLVFLVKSDGNVQTVVNRDSAKVVIYSYNTAGILRNNDINSDIIKGFQAKIVRDIKESGGDDIWMCVIAYQEIWNAGQVFEEQFNKILDWIKIRPSLEDKVIKFTENVMKQVFEDRKREMTCKLEKNETLLTVACRLLPDSKGTDKKWLVEAFRYGWNEYGSKTSRNILGFKGVLAVSINLGNDKYLLVVNVHLSSKSVADRWKAIRVIRDQVEPYLQVENFSVVILGDFNARSFSLVSPSMAYSHIAKFENNPGAGFLLLCLTDSLGAENFKDENEKKEFCKDVHQKAKEYDEISYFFKREFPTKEFSRELKEVSVANADPLMPTFSFNINPKEKIIPYLRPAKKESIPSYTDRMFYINSVKSPLEWSKYADIRAPEGQVEFSDHRPIIGIFTFKIDEADQYKFENALVLPQPRKLPSEADNVTFSYRKEEVGESEWKYPAKPNGVDLKASPEYTTYRSKGYSKLGIDHNEMLKTLHLKGYRDFLEFAKKMFDSIEAKNQLKMII